METSVENQVENLSYAGNEYDRIVCESTASGTWELVAPWRDHVLGPHAPNWFALESDSRAIRVKSGHHRTVYRVKLGDRAVFAKVYDDSANSLLKRIFAKRASEREWRSTIEMQRRKIPVVQPIGFGVSSRSKQASVFLTEEFAGAVTLSSFWDQRRKEHGCESVQLLIRTVARLLATAHERGFVPRDNHPANMLVFVDGSSDVQVRFVDVLGAKLRAGVISEVDRARSLAQLDQFFERAASRSQRFRFVHSYFKARCKEKATKSALRNRVRTFQPRFVEAKLKHAAALVRRRDRRLRGDGKYFAKIELGDGWTAFVVLKLARRRVFPEPRVEDRSAADWLPILRTIIESAQIAMERGKTSFSPEWNSLNESLAELQIDVLFQDYSANMRHGAALRDFKLYHQLRHRDKMAPLWLAVLEYRRRGLIAGEIMVFPTRTAEELAQIEDLFET